MIYPNLRSCLTDLEKQGHLLRIKDEVDPFLEMAEIQRQVYAANGPALFFEQVKGSPFPAVSNLFGDMERTRFIFRDTLAGVQDMVQAKINPKEILHQPGRWTGLASTALNALPKKMDLSQFNLLTTTLDQLPQLKSWPNDGGAFLTLPQVLTLDPDNPSLLKSNLGMYRVQISGNRYLPNRQAGLHYQIQRGIAVHHSRALARGEALKVSIFLGGPPAHTFAAVMPLPEGLPELAFAGALAGRRFRYFEKDGFIISADADFTITGTIETDLLPEGPFGDHLGYYSLQHLFPVLKIEQVYHRPDAIFPFTVVGRPPQEDTSFGQLVHLISGPAIPAEISGLEAVHAVDAAGVHPLLLASAHERYVPYTERQPLEILTIANAILGFGQLSLAKYLFIAAAEDKPPEIHDIAGFLQHIFSRMDFTRDLHFQTQTTMDTLDYSHFTLNRGSKVIAAAAGKQQRRLSEIWPEQWTLPEGFSRPTLVFPGVFTVNGPSALKRKNYEQDAEHLAAHLSGLTKTDGIALLVIVDEAGFCAEALTNFIWVTFTRSDPAADSYGLDAHFVDKHWTIRPPWIIDARLKDHHAPALECDPQVAEKVSEKLTQWR